MLKALNMAEFGSGIDAWLAIAHKGTEAVAMNLGTEALLYAIENSPQYSGDYAANWKVSLNRVDSSFKDSVFPDKKYPTANPYIHGDLPAILAAAAGAGTIAGFKLGDKIYLANSARHTDENGVTDYYAWKIENNEIKFRPGNNYPATIQNTLDALMLKYRYISKAVFDEWLGHRVAYERQG